MNGSTNQSLELPAPVAVLERTWRATWFVGESKLDHGIEQHNVYTADQMHQYARDYALSQTAGVAHLMTGVPDKDGREICAGDRIVYRKASGYTKEEYWNPEYIVEWKAPAFVLRHVGGGKNDSNASFAFNVAARDPSWASHLETMLAAAPAASGGEEVSRTLPIDVRGKWYEVPIPVHLHVVMLREKVNNPETFFVDEAALAEWLASLCATNDDGVATNETWEPAQRAAAFLRGELPTQAPQPPAAASVSERARALLAAEYRTHGWHEDAGRLCMGGDPTSFVEDDALRVIDRLIEQGDEDNHVITELGRLLAGIAVILKGPEPAGTAWSYHDLPELVASSLSEPRQVAAEMKAWAHTKMAEQQSSRRDRMMVSEWAKRLLPESSFPVKDFDVEGMSITKDAAREAVKRVALEQALTQQRGSVLDRPARVGGRDFKAGELVQRVVGRAHAEYDRHHGGCLRHPYTGELRDYRDVESDPDGTLCVGPGPIAATTPQPGAEAMRELVQRWREVAKSTFSRRTAEMYTHFADELESLLARGG